MKRPLTALAIITLTGCATLDQIRELIPEIPDRPKPEQPDQPADPKPESNPLGLPEGTRWIYGPDVSHWPETIPLHSARIIPLNRPNNYHRVIVSYDHLQTLPAWYQNPDPKQLNPHNVNGSIWIVREFRGQWYIGTIDYLRKGQTVKDFAAIPEYQMEPKSGDRIGVMVSTTSRQWDGTRVDGDPRSPYRERSNIVWTVWP
jgi:hypothetical protein